MVLGPWEGFGSLCRGDITSCQRLCSLRTTVPGLVATTGMTVVAETEKDASAGGGRFWRRAGAWVLRLARRGNSEPRRVLRPSLLRPPPCGRNIINVPIHHPARIIIAPAKGHYRLAGAYTRAVLSDPLPIRPANITSTHPPLRSGDSRTESA